MTIAQNKSDMPAAQVKPVLATDTTTTPRANWRYQLALLVNNPKAPLVVGGLLLSVLCVFGVKRLVVTSSAANVVVFDPVKFMNAQRSAAALMALSPNADLAFSMTQVAKQAENVITEEAQGAVVIVKQAVVVPKGIPDITDAVLTRFGLPTDVPTVTTSADKLSLEQLAPTDSSLSSAGLREEYLMELNERSTKAQEAAKNKEAQKNILP